MKVIRENEAVNAGKVRKGTKPKNAVVNANER